MPAGTGPGVPSWKAEKGQTDTGAQHIEETSFLLSGNVHSTETQFFQRGSYTFFPVYPGHTVIGVKSLPAFSSPFHGVNH